MDITRTILDAIAMMLVFNATVGMFWFVMPHAFATMLPKEIKQKAGAISKKEKLQLMSWLYPLYIGMIIWMTLSIKNAQITGYWNIFWTAYIELMFVNFGDFFFLDCILRAKVKDKDMLPGTKDCKSWQFKEWMKSAVPEHFLGWPLIICPLFSAIISAILS